MLDQLEIVNYSNGAEHDAMEGEALPLPRIDPERKVFMTSDGVEIQLTGKRINPLIVQQIQNQGKPTVPKREVILLGKHHQLVDDPHDPDYLEAVKRWEADANINSGKYLFNVGVKLTPPAEWVAENMEYLPDATAAELKYMYVVSLIPDVEDISALIEAIVSFSVVTTKGLEQAANFTTVK